MNAVFADTFYWVALSDSSDPRYREALAAESDLAGAKIITTDEVLSEFLTFFAADAWLRDRASRAVHALLNSKAYRWFRRAARRFWPAWNSIGSGQTRDTA